MEQRTKIILWVVGIVAILLITTVVIKSQTQYYETSSVSQSSAGLAVGAPSGEMVKNARIGFDAYEEATYDMDDGYAEPTSPDSTAVERLVIKTGSMSIVVKDVADAIKAVSSFATENEGFVVSSNIYKVGDIPYGTITVRIPSKIFDQGFSAMKEFGDVESESTNGQDVTEEYVDLEARLRNLKLTETRLLDILNQTGTIPEVLEVERELKIVRSEIESMQGTMKYLKDSADMSSITVNLSTDPSVLPAVDEADKWRPIGIMKEAVRSMINALEGVANLIIWFVIYIPIWLILALLVFLGIKGFKRYWK